MHITNIFLFPNFLLVQYSGQVSIFPFRYYIFPLRALATCHAYFRVVCPVATAFKLPLVIYRVQKLSRIGALTIISPLKEE